VGLVARIPFLLPLATQKIPANGVTAPTVMTIYASTNDPSPSSQKTNGIAVSPPNPLLQQKSPFPPVHSLVCINNQTKNIAWN
jgi:hypothetical protein